MAYHDHQMISPHKKAMIRGNLRITSKEVGRKWQKSKLLSDFLSCQISFGDVRIGCEMTRRQFPSDSFQKKRLPSCRAAKSSFLIVPYLDLHSLKQT